MNNDLLLDKISQSGLKRYYIAQDLEVSPRTLNNKLTGKTCFTVPEMNQLIKLLNLSEDDFKDIFLP